MTPSVIRSGFSRILPPRRACGTALRYSRPVGKPLVCCACTVECEPDGELRVHLTYQDGQTRQMGPLPTTRASRGTHISSPPPTSLAAWMARWLRRPGGTKY